MLIYPDLLKQLSLNVLHYYHMIKAFVTYIPYTVMQQFLADNAS